MGKVLRVLVVLIAIVGAAALFFAKKNFDKREALKGRASALENAIVRIAATFEEEDLPEVQAPSYAERDESPVTSREVETPERSDIWRGYKAGLEGSGEPPAMLAYGSPEMREQLRQVNGGQGGDGNELLKRAFERAKAQYNNLIATRGQLKSIREELVRTIDGYNQVKREARAAKREAESIRDEIGQLKEKVRAETAKAEAANDALAEARSQIEELNDTIALQKENLDEFDARVKEQDQIIRELKGAGGGLKVAPTTDKEVQEGVLTPGDKGRIVSADEEWKYAVIEFSPEFITELIGQDRDRPLPTSEVMVRRAGVENLDEGFVTRLKLRQILREKNLVIADILSDWQQKPVLVGDIVFY